MEREFSAGGVVVRRRAGSWWMAAIEPNKEPASGARPAAKKPPPLLALPKGLIDPGENPQQTAVREVREETGLVTTPIAKLADIKYVYVRSWAGGERVFKIVSFYLLRYRSGRIDEVSAEMRLEVRRALWIPLAEAPSLLAYKGERDVARRALEYLEGATRE